MDSKRGVGAIIGSVIIITVIFTTVASYFLSIEKGDQQINDSQIQRLERMMERASEALDIAIDDNDSLKVSIDNKSPLTTTIVYYILISLDDNSIVKHDRVNLVLENGEQGIIDLGIASNRSYMLKVVTERGSVLAATCYYNENRCNTSRV